MGCGQGGYIKRYFSTGLGINGCQTYLKDERGNHTVQMKHQYVSMVWEKLTPLSISNPRIQRAQ